MISGILNIYKEVGMTSHDVVAGVRRILHEKRVGHAGTLDPAAEGVLPVCVGHATRVVEYLSDSRKIYCADLVLGIETDTYDREGIIQAIGEVSDYSLAELERVLSKFRGAIMQVPPLYSAIKVAGQPLYKAARAGKGADIELVPRPVEIYESRITLWESPWLRLWVECGKGTYIRSLVYDIGKELGCGAYMQHLVRVQSGGFHIKDAITLSELAARAKEGSLEEVLMHADHAIGTFPAIIVDPYTAEKIRQGRNLPLEEDMPPAQWKVNTKANAAMLHRRVYTDEGDFLALLEREGQEWHPSKVFI
ncbi:tRNA pseudouridine(55) synthase TruB [Candidatus Chlorohelix sp.]|uniref:tRNA pseudouridine(55) synthase TruB n=1 Tax=Candidatus Chlorohelix sp. TaxID=3139201 RepID=UPI003063B382